MENQTFLAPIILISEWDYERKIEVVVVGDQVYIYVNRQLVVVKPAAELYQKISEWANDN